MKPTLWLLCGVLACAVTGAAIELKSETAQAFDAYISTLERRLAPQFRGEHFLLFDDTASARDQLQRGMILTKPVKGNGLVAIKGGLIQDWIGAAFVPKTTLANALATLQDFDHNREIYKPDIAETRLVSHEGNRFLVHFRVVKSKFLITDVLNTEQEISFIPINSTKAYSTNYSRRIAEISDPGKPAEHELPVGQDRGLLWRLYGYWFFEERDGGVYIACESITLTRDVPALLAKLLNPIVHDVPAEALHKSLDQTRQAIQLHGGGV